MITVYLDLLPSSKSGQDMCLPLGVHNLPSSKSRQTICLPLGGDKIETKVNFPTSLQARKLGYNDVKPLKNPEIFPGQTKIIISDTRSLKFYMNLDKTIPIILLLLILRSSQPRAGSSYH